ncbi:hypothetical protein KMP13_04220 [Epibacterium ulvae]|uniref:hypothetical protein n=1 Tax=Epibacterium ulvae TaxID=1156985 RepID=UPI001BFCC8FB|nr:hypothetical protein [Epibacterium ulvae]MBT8153106.1 hypothetical protein [Epibacterium ulvae]
MRATLGLGLSTVLTALIASGAAAQDVDGKDTASNWRVTHFETFGIYLSSCDERMEGETLSQRCYLRYVDIFSQKPKFAAQFMFVTNGDAGPEVEFGLEAGTLFGPNGFRIEDAGEEIWKTRRIGCLTGLSCTFDDTAAAGLLDAMQSGDAFRFTFRDSHGQSQDLSWPLEGFDAAMQDFRAQSDLRGL